MTREPAPRRKAEVVPGQTEVSKRPWFRFSTRQWFIFTAVLSLFLVVPASIHLFLTMSSWVIMGVLILGVPLFLQFLVLVLLRPLSPSPLEIDDPGNE